MGHTKIMLHASMRSSVRSTRSWPGGLGAEHERRRTSSLSSASGGELLSSGDVPWLLSLLPRTAGSSELSIESRLVQVGFGGHSYDCTCAACSRDADSGTCCIFQERCPEAFTPQRQSATK